VWNQLSQEQWGLRADETEGKTLLSLDVGLPVAPLAEPIRRCLAGSVDHEELVVDAVNRRGRDVRTRVRVSPLRGKAGEIEGVIILTDDEPV
jgi:two-component system CheB/CheR fusion protein